MRIEGALGTSSRWGVGFTLTIAVAAGLAQQTTAPPQSKPIMTPQNRAADSYEIYSELLPGREIEWGDAPRSFWLIERTTKAEPLNSPCTAGGMMNPHEAIRAPQSEQTSFSEVLADFDRTCHDRYQLDASQFHLKLPVRLLDEEGKKRYVSHVSGYMPPKSNIMQAPPTPEEFKGAAGLHSFTAVYFNSAHTLAMTEIGMYCGGLCGNWRWVVLERKNGQWEILPWTVMSAIS
jgi:hypothetical protein